MDNKVSESSRLRRIRKLYIIFFYVSYYFYSVSYTPYYMNPVLVQYAPEKRCFYMLRVEGGVEKKEEREKKTTNIYIYKRNNIITGSQHTHAEETFASAIRNQLGT